MYAIHPDGHRVCIPPLQIGFHNLNRNGIGCNGQRCDQLLSQVLGHFDYREACHDAVAIEDQPGQRYFWLSDRDVCAGDELLALCNDA